MNLFNNENNTAIKELLDYYIASEQNKVNNMFLTLSKYSDFKVNEEKKKFIFYINDLVEKSLLIKETICLLVENTQGYNYSHKDYIELTKEELDLVKKAKAFVFCEQTDLLKDLEIYEIGLNCKNKINNDLNLICNSVLRLEENTVIISRR